LALLFFVTIIQRRPSASSPYPEIRLHVRCPVKHTGGKAATSLPAHICFDTQPPRPYHCLRVELLTKPMRILIDFVYLLVAVAISPLVLYRLLRHNRYRTGWAQRLGKITRRDPGKKCIWLHAVSVGEVNAARTVISQLSDRFSDYEIVISTTTDTGFARASALFAQNHEVFYFPFDFSWIMHRAFRNVRPSLCLLMELEVWPNFVGIAARSGIPVVVVNGRLSDRSFAAYRRFRWFARRMFSRLTLVLAQTEEYARRFKELGCDEKNVIVSGSLKYDTAQTTDKVEGADALASRLAITNQRLWVAGGTGNDEEAPLLEVYKQLRSDSRLADLRLAIVPRKPERFEQVASLIRQMGFSLIRYSQLKDADGPAPTGTDAVILGDTMGDLRKFYALATVIFVGRSLVPMGGSDMMEAAALGKCTIFGPHAFNFRQTVQALLAEDGAILVNNQRELLQALKKCLTNPDYARRIAENGRKVIIKNQGATKKTIQQVARLLGTIS